MISLALLCSSIASQQAIVDWRPTVMAGVSGSADKQQFLLESNAIAARMDARGMLVIEDRWNKKQLNLGSELFEIRLKAGRIIRSSETGKKSQFRIEPIALSPKRGTGFRVSRSFEDPASGLAIDWSMVVTEQAHYLRSFVTLRPLRKPVEVARVSLVKAVLTGARPSEFTVLSGLWFLRDEDCHAPPIVRDGTVEIRVDLANLLETTVSRTYSSVIGVVPEGQRRRAIQNYVDLEREGSDQPTINFVVASGGKEGSAVANIRKIGAEFQARNVKIDYFVVSNWEAPPGSGKAENLRPLTQASLRFGAKLGLVSDVFGYGLSNPGGEVRRWNRSSPERTAFQRRMIDLLPKVVEANQIKAFFQLSPAEFGCGLDQPLRNVDDESNLMTALISKVPDMSFFGGPPLRSRGSESSISEPNLDLQTNFFLRAVIGRDDNVFRQTRGVEPIRNCWSDFSAKPLGEATTLLLASEVILARAYFTSGARHGLISLDALGTPPEVLDQVAKAARWARANADTLKDSHFVGGRPGSGEVYGYAAWTPKKAILTLRNPNPIPTAFSLSLASVFELPMGYRATYKSVSPWPEDSARPAEFFDSKIPKVVILQPFESRTWEMTPIAGAPK